MRPAKTKDRNRHQIAPLEVFDSDVSLRSSAQDIKDQKRTGDDGEDVQAQDARSEQARNPSVVRQGHLGPPRAWPVKSRRNVRQPTCKE